MSKKSSQFLLFYTVFYILLLRAISEKSYQSVLVEGKINQSISFAKIPLNLTKNSTFQCLHSEYGIILDSVNGSLVIINKVEGNHSGEYFCTEINCFSCSKWNLTITVTSISLPPKVENETFTFSILNLSTIQTTPKVLESIANATSTVTDMIPINITYFTNFSVRDKTPNAVRLQFVKNTDFLLKKFICYQICGESCRKQSFCNFTNETQNLIMLSINNIYGLKSNTSYDIWGLFSTNESLYLGSVTTMKRPKVKFIANSYDYLCFSIMNADGIKRTVHYKIKRNDTPQWVKEYFSTNHDCIYNLNDATSYDVQIKILYHNFEDNFIKSYFFYNLSTEVKAPKPPDILSSFYDEANLNYDIRLRTVKKVVAFIAKFEHCSYPDRFINATTLKKNGSETILEIKIPNNNCDVWLRGSVKRNDGKLLYGSFVKVIRPISRYNDDSIKPKNNDSKSSTAVIIVATLISIFAVILAIVFVFVYRRCFQRNSYNYDNIFLTNGNNSIPSMTNKKVEITKLSDNDLKPIFVNDWEKHVTRLRADGDVGFSLQYSELEKATLPIQFSSTVSNHPENRAKNRYVNILAYDSSRIKLGNSTNVKHNYINANYIDGYNSEKTYIAAQGPLPSTFNDFWKMIWQERCTVIVVITNMTEKGRKKCDQYWPNTGEETYGNFTVKLMSTTERAFYVLRVFSLKQHSSDAKCDDDIELQEEHMIAHYHFTDWKDHSRPAYAIPVLHFINKSASANSENSGPILVHCSAGVGRTGTYIVLDSMMREIRDKGTVSLLSFLYKIRHQRNHLVQTEEQYIFIHDALLEFIKKGGDSEIKESEMSRIFVELAAVKLQRNSDDIDATSSLISSNSRSSTLKSRKGFNGLERLNIESQFELINSYQPKEFMHAVALNQYNAVKNRSPSHIPLTISRVKLPMTPGEENSDYINATYLPGYFKRNEFIVTQVPITETREHFWTMIIDHAVTVIVQLTGDDDEDTDYFGVFECAKFRIEIADDNHELNYVKRLYRINVLGEEQYEMTTTLITCSYWPESFTPLTTAFEIIDLIKKMYIKESNSEPIVVIDKFGGSRAGKFCFLSVLQDELKNEAVVDVLSLCLLYQLMRPGFLSAQMDLSLLYRAIECLCNGYNRDRDSGIGNCPDNSKNNDDHQESEA